MVTDMVTWMPLDPVAFVFRPKVRRCKGVARAESNNTRRLDQIGLGRKRDGNMERGMEVPWMRVAAPGNGSTRAYQQMKWEGAAYLQ